MTTPSLYLRVPTVLLVFAAAAGAQDVQLDDPLHSIHRLALQADEEGPDGPGPSASLEWTSDFEGSLYVWAASEGLEPVLRVRDGEERLLAEEDGNGGFHSPCAVVPTVEGTLLEIRVSVDEPEAAGQVELHLVSAPETDASRAALERGKGLLSTATGASFPDAVEALLESEDAARSRELALFATDLAHRAFGAGEAPSSARAFSLAQRHWGRCLPPDHPERLAGCFNLARVLHEVGDLPGARALEEEALVGMSASLPPDHVDLISVQNNLAITRYRLGDLRGARALMETVLEARERGQPEDSPGILDARANLAVVLHGMGDLPGARALQEAVLEVRERTLPPEHPDLLYARQNLANTLFAIGDMEGSLFLREIMLEGLDRTRSEEDPELFRARASLAANLRSLGDLEGARDLELAALDALERALPEGHPDAYVARVNRSSLLFDAREFAAARTIQEQVVESLAGKMSPAHVDLLTAKVALLKSVYALGDRDGVRSLLPDVVATIHARIASAMLGSPREAREVLRADTRWLDWTLSLCAWAELDLDEELFALIETRRLASVSFRPGSSLRAGEEELRELADEVARARAALGDLASGASRSALSEREHLDRLHALTRERDAAERALRAASAARGFDLEPVSAASVRAALPADAAAVGFLRTSLRESTERSDLGEPRILAHVLRPDSALVRIDLGPAAELAEQLDRWRAAVGAPLRSARGASEDTGEREAPGRGVGVAAGGATDGADARAEGEALRARLLDPVLAAAGEEATTLHVCLDDLLFLVPLDALPLADGCVGDRVRIIARTSFGKLADAPHLSDEPPTLLVLGGPDFDGEGDMGPSLAGAAPIEVGDRGAGGDVPFAPLAEAAREAEALAALFERAFGRTPEVLLDERATKAELARAAPGARFLHLATHGWFAPETTRSVLDSEGRSSAELAWPQVSAGQQTLGFAPLTLCGVALAGANAGVDAQGRVPGILTAEELAAFDLSGCELAVLSACETNVGVRRAGQGIQSLQAALFAAGARSSITSLWKVDDAAARELMEHLYTDLWVEKLPKADALWRAKVALREAGRPVRDWAGWVLTGDPD